MHSFQLLLRHKPYKCLISIYPLFSEQKGIYLSSRLIPLDIPLFLAKLLEFLRPHSTDFLLSSHLSHSPTSFASKPVEVSSILRKVNKTPQSTII